MGSADSTLALPLTTGALERPLGVQETDFSWEQCSPNIVLSQDDPTVFRRVPVAQRTDMARGGLTMEHGLYLWKYTWPTNQRGTHAVIGVCTEEQPNSVSGYTHLLGSTKFSWGWDLSKRGLYHGGKRSNYSSCHEDVIPEVVVMIVDMDAGTLAFEVDSRYQGIAFTGLKGFKLYAAASTVWGNCEVGLKYLGSYAPALAETTGPSPLDSPDYKALRLELIETMDMNTARNYAEGVSLITSVEADNLLTVYEAKGRISHNRELFRVMEVGGESTLRKFAYIVLSKLGPNFAARQERLKRLLN